MSLAAVRKFAIAAHGNQEYDGKPYRVHLQHVVNVLIRFGVRSAVILEAAWLHDVLEDTSVTADTLRELFGYGLARTVYAVTNEPGANRNERAIKTYQKIRWYGVNAVVLKVADRIANTEYSIEHRDSQGQKMKMYREEFPAFSTALFVSGECDSMWDYLRSISTETK
jgi:guanosine-3',5'-bis(diphosphate) 3'-pyrophosphohydrolase